MSCWVRASIYSNSKTVLMSGGYDGVLVGHLLMLHLSDLADSLGLKECFGITSSHTQLLRLHRLMLASVHRDRQITEGQVQEQ
jgi:hypothetical protein